MEGKVPDIRYNVGFIKNLTSEQYVFYGQCAYWLFQYIACITSLLLVSLSNSAADSKKIATLNDCFQMAAESNRDILKRSELYTAYINATSPIQVCSENQTINSAYTTIHQNYTSILLRYSTYETIREVFFKIELKYYECVSINEKIQVLTDLLEELGKTEAGAPSNPKGQSGDFQREKSKFSSEISSIRYLLSQYVEEQNYAQYELGQLLGFNNKMIVPFDKTLYCADVIPADVDTFAILSSPYLKSLELKIELAEIELKYYGGKYLHKKKVAKLIRDYEEAKVREFAALEDAEEKWLNAVASDSAARKDFDSSSKKSWRMRWQFLENEIGEDAYIIALILKSKAELKSISAALASQQQWIEMKFRRRSRISHSQFMENKNCIAVTKKL